jgi:hypothetical protein
MKRIDAEISKLRDQTLKMKTAISHEYSLTDLKIQQLRSDHGHEDEQFFGIEGGNNNETARLS